MGWNLVVNGVTLLVLVGGCAHAPKPIPGSVEFWQKLFGQAQEDLEQCEKDRLQCEVDCDVIIPYVSQ